MSTIYFANHPDFRVQYYPVHENVLITLNDTPILKYYPSAIPIADELYTALNSETPWTTSQVFIGGRLLDEARETCLMATDLSKSYTYSGTKKTVQPVSAPIMNFAGHLTPFLQEKLQPNLYLLNRYSPSQYICEHADDEKDMDATQSIWSLSLGQCRTLVVREKPSVFKRLRSTDTIRRSWRYELPMEHGSLIEFCPTMQDWFTHEVIKPRKTKGEIDQLANSHYKYRINVTARVFH